ncbi:hypothetical protein Ahy_A07g034164 isoform A [Arachis hypogaea]|uniref:Uncharacterized protein n=1 Tax=Arachis hypogaea TaxID=3818 RepID=A0A445CB30_ARAHY|nr:hypothetical protein Ahy_A07g034164 isoform A [Arachis hypogaea]
MIHFKNARSRCYVSLLESEVVKIATMGLAKIVRKVEILRKGKEKFKSEKKLKNKIFARKEKVSYVKMESSSEEFDVEFPKVDLAKLKKGPPYVCSFLQKITSMDKANDMKYLMCCLEINN